MGESEDDVPKKWGQTRIFRVKEERLTVKINENRV